MRESAALFTALILLVGCNSTPPSLNNLMAPYGNTRVPPPSTGSFARPDSYYQPSPRTGLSSNGSDSQYATSGSPSRGVPANATLAPAPTAEAQSPSPGVQLVSMDQAGLKSTGSSTKIAPAPVSNESAVRIVEAPTARSTGSTQLKGMTVNDATQPSEPNAFQPGGPMKDLSQFPQSGVSTVPQSTAPTPSSPSSSSSGSDSWKSKEDGSTVVKVAGR